MRSASSNARWRRLWLIGGSCLSAVLLLLLASGPSSSKISFDPATWAFSRSHKESVTLRRFKTVRTTTQFGPIKIVSTAIHSHQTTETAGTTNSRSLETIRTNLLHVGDMLHNPANDKERWKIVGMETLRDSPSGTNRTNVTVRSLLTGRSARIPRELLFQRSLPPSDIRRG